MTIYLAAEDNAALSDLVDRALVGEGVVVTRGGKAIAEITAVPLDKRWNTNEEMLAWLRERRVSLREGSSSISESLKATRDEY
jgi:antitoxin (DNA-binding transcriptional repressor) of toxin-antitoxin stability system